MVIVVVALALDMASDRTAALGFTAPTGRLSVTLLQGNIPQEEKFASEHQGAALQWHVE